MAQTHVGRKVILTKKYVIGPQFAPRLRQSGGEETKEAKIGISINLRVRTEFLRSTTRNCSF
jgi:hypothetical protein